MLPQRQHHFRPRPESVTKRGRVFDAAPRAPELAFALAQTIPDGWYRCQAMTMIASVASEPLADKAFQAAREAAATGEDAYQRTAVLAQTLHAAIACKRGDLAKAIFSDILAQAPTVEPMGSRAYALGWAWAVVRSAGDPAMQEAVLDAVATHCAPDRSWRAARLYRDIAEDLADADPGRARQFVAAMPEGKARTKIERRLAADVSRKR